MQLNDLDYFVTLAEEGNFTKASQKKFVSQPSITNAVHRLEEELKETLIIRGRGTRAIRLTPAGDILLRHSKIILRETQIIKSEISNQHKIALGVPPIVGASIFPKIMAQLGATQIDAFHMVEAGSNLMTTLLDQDKIDLGFIGTLTPEKSKHYNSFFITKSPFVVILPLNHPLASRDYLSFEELRGQRFISVSEQFTHHQVLLKQLHDHGMTEEIDNMYLTKELWTEQGVVAAGNGVGIMVKIAVADRKDLAIVPLAEPIDFYYYLIQKRDHQLSDFQEETQNKIIEVIKTLDF